MGWQTSAFIMIDFKDCLLSAAASAGAEDLLFCNFVFVVCLSSLSKKLGLCAYLANVNWSPLLIFSTFCERG